MAACLLLAALTADDFATGGADNKLSMACLMPLIWHTYIFELLPRSSGPNGIQPLLVYVTILAVFPLLYGSIIYWLLNIIFRKQRAEQGGPGYPSQGAGSPDP